ncbi:MAG: xylulokinase [Eubacterium sp.]|jgi:sugar (pentulose or hexulose) kinase|nr:carbohydrate kinase FGGY [Clostridium sp. CAG:167]
MSKSVIESGKAVLGIEFGSTRIKAVLVDDANKPIASGSHEWENQLKDGIWTYSIDMIWEGLQHAYKEMTEDVEKQYGVKVEKLAALGFSAMMHGYMAFGADDEILVPFRTWRNAITEEASEKLTKLFNYNIPQRWSIAHLYQAILNGEDHVKDIKFQTTLAGYIHWKLTGRKVLGVGEASGMFPIDIATGKFNQTMVDAFNKEVEGKGYPWKLLDIFPEVLTAGENAGELTAEGAKLLDPTGTLQAGCPLCPPEGDAGTGMVATNSVARRTGNVSAGTSVFSMVVLEKELSKVYPELDLVTTPSGDLVAMVHCNNCTSDLNAWVNIFKEFAEAFGVDVDMNKLFGTLYNKAMEGDVNGGNLLAYNYISGENITGMEEGRPLFVRTPNSKFNLANFMRVNLYTALGALKIGMDLLLKEEGVQVDKLLGHGGLFKTKGVGQQILADAMNTPISVMETAGEGGAWGIAVLASYMVQKAEGESLGDYLNNKVFAGQEGSELAPDPEGVKGFDEFIEIYKAGLPIQRAAIDSMAL